VVTCRCHPDYHDLGTHAPTNPAATVSQGKAVRRRGTTLARLRRWFRTFPFHADEMCD
jgi:hypothetical protein